MRKSVLRLVLVLGSAVLGGCGSSLQEVIVDAALSSAKESLESAVDETVDRWFEEWLEMDALAVDDEQPDE